MRRMGGAVCVGLAGIALVACGGRVQSDQPPPTPECQHAILTASDPVSLDTLGGQRLSIAGTPAGDRFFIVADDGSGDSHGYLVRVEATTSASAPFDVVRGGVAAFDAGAFAVVAADRTAGLSVQRFDTSGAPVGSPTRVAVTGDASSIDVQSVVSTPDGLAVAWQYVPPPGARVELHAALVGRAGEVTRDSVLSSSAYHAAKAAPPVVGLAFIDGRTVAVSQTGLAADEVTLTDLGQFTNSPATLAIPATVGTWSSGPIPFGDQLAFGATVAQDTSWLYTGPPQGPYSRTMTLPSAVNILGGDGCGRIVDLHREQTGLVAQQLKPWSSGISMSRVVIPPAIASTDVGFGVVSYAPWAQFSTLTWR